VLASDLVRAAKDGPDAVISRVARELAGFEHRATRAAPHAHLFTRGRSAPRLVLSGHVDVVPVGEGWARDPFGGDVADDRVWGRGAADMLGSVACFVEAATRAAPEAPCAILLTTDEETGMRAAEAALAEGLLHGAEAIVVGEPTALDVGIAEKGVLWARIEARGTNAHGSMPELGDNAVQRAVRIASRLASYHPPGEHPLLGRGTAGVHRIHGGDAVNQVPAAAWLEVDVRYLPGTKEDEVVEALRRATESEGRGLADVRVISSHPPFEIPPDSPLARSALAASGGRALGLPYGTEASRYAPAGIPTVILGPGEPDLAHTNRENVALEALERATEAYAKLLRAYA